MRRAVTATRLVLALGAIAPGAHAQTPSVTLQITSAKIAFGTATAVIYAGTGPNGGARIDATPEYVTLTAGAGLRSVTATLCVTSTGLAAASSATKPPDELEFSLDGSTGWTGVGLTGTPVLTTTLAPSGTYGAQTLFWRVLLRAGDVPNMATNRVVWSGTVTHTLVLGNVPCP